MPRHTFTVTQDPQSPHFALAADLTESGGFRSDATVMAATRDGATDAVAVFQNFTTAGCEVHFGATRANVFARRDILKAFCYYAFYGLKVPALTAIIPADNRACMGFALKVGFRPSGFMLANHLCLADALIMSMPRADCLVLPPQAPHTTLTEHPVQ